jgi:hypothetical protein
MTASSSRARKHPETSRVRSTRMVTARSVPTPDGRQTVEVRFTPWGNGTTYVEVTEDGLCGEGDEILAHATGSTGGFTIVLCALKALLEHDVILTAVLDRFPQGLEH